MPTRRSPKLTCGVEDWDVERTYALSRERRVEPDTAVAPPNSSNPSLDEAKSHLESIRFSRFTMVKLHPSLLRERPEDPLVRVDEALACHHDLDPDALGLRTEVGERNLSWLARGLAAEPDNPVAAYLKDVPALTQAVVRGELKCELRQPEPLASLIDLREFGKYMSDRAGNCNMAREERNEHESATTQMTMVEYGRLRLGPLDAHAEAMLMAMDAWRDLARGGAVVHGVWQTQPDILKVLEEQYPDEETLSTNKRKAIALVARPGWAAKGRPAGKSRSSS